MIPARVLALAVALALTGCASTPPPYKAPQYFKAYTLNQTNTTNVGAPFFANQNGSIEQKRRWVGLLFAPGGWEYYEDMSTDYVRQELLYGGRSGDTIEVSYREFRRGMAAQAFTQSLKYDLGLSKFIQFQRFRIEVLDANNQTITARVVSD